MRHLQGLVAADQRPSSNIRNHLYEHNLNQIKGKSEKYIRDIKIHKDFKKLHTYHTHICNALFQDILFISYLCFLSWKNN